MTSESLTEKQARFQAALDAFIRRLADDRYVLAIVLVGSLSEELMWRKESIGLWIIEADGVSRRLRSDGADERIFRTLVENGINIHAELIPRTRFKRIVEGSSRTAFSCNFLAHRQLIYSKDPSIEHWFDEASQIATKDQARELLTFSTWTIHAHRRARQRLDLKQDVALARQEVLEAAHSVAYTEIIRSGQVWEQDAIYRGLQLNPSLFETIYTQVLESTEVQTIEAALAAIDTYLMTHHPVHLKPLLAYLKKANRTVPLSEISDHFAYSQVYPWHIESACEWLERKGMLDKLSVPFKLTARSLESAEEPAYFLSQQ